MKSQKCPLCDGTGKQIDQRALGSTMKTLRKDAGLSLRQVAKVLVLSAPYLSDLERGNRRWNTFLIQAYKNACKQ